jgi:AraC-like DNA-binding protein
LLLATVIFTTKKHRAFRNIILACILVVFALLILSIFTTSMGIWPKFMLYHKQIFLLRQTAFILGPLVYFYILSVFNQKNSFSTTGLFHFIPYIFFSVYFIVQLNSINEFVIWDTPLTYLSSGFILLQNIGYLLLAIIMLKYHHTKFKDIFLSKGEPHKFWLGIFMVLFIALWLLKLHFFLYWDIGKNYNVCPSTNNMYFLVFFFLINILWFFSLSNPEIFQKKTKYRNSLLTAEEKKSKTRFLLSYMEEKEPFLNPDISLSSLAKETGISAKHLSQIINEYANKNFNDLINTYRVEKSKKLMKGQYKNEKYISEILYAVGFNSRSSFYNAFKKNTGLTPGEYLKLNP